MIMAKRTALLLTITAGHQLYYRTEAFLSSSPYAHKSFRLPIQNKEESILSSMNMFRGIEDGGNIEEARELLEEMISIPQDDILSAQDSNSIRRPQHHHIENHQLSFSPRSIEGLRDQIASDPPPPLTTIRHKRLEAELELIESLTSSDAAIKNLWALWFSERGPDAARVLLRAEELSSQAVLGNSQVPVDGDKRLQEAEDLLWDLIEKYGVYWVEPVNRLATIMYVRGKFQDSKRLCEVVLSVKPWHVGALNGIVMACAAMNDVTTARAWAEKRLPPLQESYDELVWSRRRAWVKWAAHDAKNKLLVFEKMDRRDADIGVKEVKFRTMRRKLQRLNEVNAIVEERVNMNDNAWQ